MTKIFQNPNPPIFDPKVDLKKEMAMKIAETEARIEMRVSLPFLYGWKWYKWAKTFYDSQNKINLLCAGNQLSKSSTMIRKCINWATDVPLWTSLWDHKPNQFWYFYPSYKQVNTEFETKWKQFLPAGRMKDDPYYGWREERSGGNVVAIHFNSGVHIYFKSYEQSVTSLQSGTVDAMFCDEEMPIELFDELMFRLTSSNGYFHMAFTATLGQDFWRRAMDPGQNEKEECIGALKITASLYDSMYYEDGTQSKWTMERIKAVEARCSTHNEILKRVYGKFIVLGGRKYEAFDIKRHLKPKHNVPRTWLIYGGVDTGSGGKEGHPSAIVYVAVNPNYKEARVFLGWRGDGIDTTAGDVVTKALDLKKQHNLKPTQQFYDWSNKDFFNIAQSAGDPYEKAEKSHEIGEDVINTLFKHDMMFIYEDEELLKLAGELATLLRNTPKKSAKDDFTDALRYAVTKIPWDWSGLSADYIEGEKKTDEELTPMQLEIKERREAFIKSNQEEQDRIDDEFNEWNDQYG